jgi:acyl-CoA thioester hydrolase
VTAPAFHLDVEVGRDDVDELAHVNNLVYVRWVLDVATAHSAAVGWDFPAYRRAGGVFVVRRQEVDYLRPAFLGERVRVETWVESFTRVTSLRRSRIVGAAGELARAATTWAFVSVEGGRPTRIPEEILAAFSVDGRRPP